MHCSCAREARCQRDTRIYVHLHSMAHKAVCNGITDCAIAAAHVRTRLYYGMLSAQAVRVVSLCTGPCLRVASGARAPDADSALVCVARCKLYCQSSVSSQACDFHLCFKCAECAGLSRTARNRTCDVVGARRIRCAHCLTAFRSLQV